MTVAEAVVGIAVLGVVAAIALSSQLTTLTAASHFTGARDAVVRTQMLMGAALNARHAEPSVLGQQFAFASPACESEGSVIPVGVQPQYSEHTCLTIDGSAAEGYIIEATVGDDRYVHVEPADPSVAYFLDRPAQNGSR